MWPWRKRDDTNPYGFTENEVLNRSRLKHREFEGAGKWAIPSALSIAALLIVLLASGRDRDQQYAAFVPPTPGPAITSASGYLPSTVPSLSPTPFAVQAENSGILTAQQMAATADTLSTQIAFATQHSLPAASPTVADAPSTEVPQPTPTLPAEIIETDTRFQRLPFSGQQILDSSILFPIEHAISPEELVTIGEQLQVAPSDLVFAEALTQALLERKDSAGNVVNAIVVMNYASVPAPTNLQRLRYFGDNDAFMRDQAVAVSDFYTNLIYGLGANPSLEAFHSAICTSESRYVSAQTCQGVPSENKFIGSAMKFINNYR